MIKTNGIDEKNLISSKLPSSLYWYCNRGLTIRYRYDDELRCLCPPSYYGNQCEYENERVSLTIGFVRTNQNEIFLFFVVLIDDDNEDIQSYFQYEYYPNDKCLTKIHRYLLYSTRPKDRSKIYSIRIDQYDKRHLTYMGTYFYSIPFQFYPVNRLAIYLSMLNIEMKRSSLCSPLCVHGQCLQYVNKDKFFCRCHSFWKGIQCDIPMNCSNCSSDSICYSTKFNESICLCPLNSYGRRCLLKWSCSFNHCFNGGECVTNSFQRFLCLCPKEYFGSQCEYRRNEIQVKFVDLSMSSFVIGFFFL